jgi:hypothetical protein
MTASNSPEEPQSNRKLSSRATNFLLSMGSSAGQVSQTGSIAPEPAEVSEPAPTHLASGPENSSPAADRKTGVISSTIYPAQRQASPEVASAARTNQLGASVAGTQSSKKTSKSLSPIEKAKLQEEKIDNLAERITNVLKQISDLRTGMLNPELSPSRKLQWLADKYPRLSRFLERALKQIEPVIRLMQRINQKLIEKNLIQARRPQRRITDDQPLDSPQAAPPQPAKVSFLELAEKNIIFCDNRKRPLYSIEQMRGKHGYTASEEVLVPMIMENIIQAFQEVAPKARAIPTPQSGLYAGKPMDVVMNQITENEIMLFLNYVQKFPRGYVGKNFRITESFAGWVVSGTPDD